MQFVDVTNAGNRLTVRVVGDLDMQSAPALIAVVDLELSARHPLELAFDFEGLTFLDSTGLAMLVAYRNTGATRGYGMVLQNLRPRFLRLLTLTGLADVFLIE